MLLVDLKRVFNHISRNYLLCIIEGMRVYNDLIRLTESFISDRSMSLLIDVHQCTETIIGTGVPQGSPVSPVLFAIFLKNCSWR